MLKSKKNSKATKTKSISYKRINLEDDLDSDEFEAMMRALPSYNKLETPSLNSSVASGTLTSDSSPKSNSNTYHEESISSDFEPEEDEDDVRRYDFDIFQEVIQEIPINKKQFKNGTRASMSFSNARCAIIDRDNQLLLNRIMHKGPSGDSLQKKSKPHFSHNNSIKENLRSSAEVNRKKKQRQIDMDNQLLKKKLDVISRRSR